ncbi:glycosyltransferase family 2 protein [Frigoriglobus tundricola]|nr:glycosyltransferase family 2 protein [Frigoriglobus tundricola]
MSEVKFSVVIPTRERADTLRFALRTCLDQTFDDYEVIVSDNFSSPATRAVVDEAGSPKVRYVRTAGPVAMSSNWEFGVGHARGEYVVLIGDDDGLLPHALAELDRLTRAHGAKAVQWTAAYYTWPTVALPGQGNYLRVPFGCGLGERDGAAAIRDVAAFRAFYTDLPMLYNAAVHRDVLAELKRRTGRVFRHLIPDVYSGFAVAHAAGRYLSTTVPMSVSGQSAASNGIATLFHHGRSEIDREFHALNAQDGFRSDPTVPDLAVFPHVPVADAFACAKRALFPDLPVAVDRRALSAACVAGARVAEADWPAARAAVRAALADRPDLLAWFDAELGPTPYRPPAPVRLRPEHLGFDGATLHLDAAAFGVTDVAGAALLCERLLDFRDRPVQYAGSADDPHVAAMKISDLAYLCDERERAILRLHLATAELQRACDERSAMIHQISRTAGAQVRELDQRLQVAEGHLDSERRWSLKRPVRAAKKLLDVTTSTLFKRPAGAR